MNANALNAAPIRHPKERRLEVLDLVAAGKTLSEVSRQPGMPNRRTFSRWAEGDEEFKAGLAQARRAGAEFHAAKSLSVFDAVDTDSKTAMAQVKLATELSKTHRWHASVLDPRRWAEKQAGVVLTTDSGSGVLLFAALAGPQAVAARASVVPSSAAESRSLPGGE